MRIIRSCIRLRAQLFETVAYCFYHPVSRIETSTDESTKSLNKLAAIVNLFSISPLSHRCALKLKTDWSSNKFVVVVKLYSPWSLCVSHIQTSVTVVGLHCCSELLLILRLSGSSVTPTEVSGITNGLFYGEKMLRGITFFHGRLHLFTGHCKFWLRQRPLKHHHDPQRNESRQASSTVHQNDAH